MMNEIESTPAPNGMKDGQNDAASAQGWMAAGKSENAVSLLTANELTSLTALIAYVAFQKGQSEFRVERSLADHFHIPNAKCLPANQFDSAIRYLVDTASA